MTCIWPFPAELYNDFPFNIVPISSTQAAVHVLRYILTIYNNDRVASDSYSVVRMAGFPKKSICKFAASKAANKNGIFSTSKQILESVYVSGHTI